MQGALLCPLLSPSHRCLWHPPYGLSARPFHTRYLTSSHTDPERFGPQFSEFTDEEADSERLCNLPKVTQWGSGIAWINPGYSDFKGPPSLMQD